MKKLAKHRSFLLKLSKNPKLIKKATLAELSCVLEILHNLDCIPFTKQEKTNVCPHLNRIRQIARCSRERKARECFNQYGAGFLSFIIPAALTLAGLLQ